jgi:DNA-binding PucR family transcriptional regulator
MGTRVKVLATMALWAAAVPGILLAVDAPAPRGALTTALDRVRLVIDLGRRLGRTGLLTPDDIALEMLLAGSPATADALVSRVIGPLRGASGQRAGLEDTLRTFIAVQTDRRSAATELHIHRNTLDYRLRRIEDLTQLRLADPRDMTIIVLALSHSALHPQAV